jgi:transposase
MLEAIKQGESDPQILAELAKGRLREKLPALRLALDGRVQAHHQLLIGELLDHLDYLDRAIHRVEVNIAALVAQEEKAVELLLTLPATGPVTAAAIIAEIGVDMVRRIGGRQGVQRKLLGLLEKPMRTYLIPAQVA